MHTFLWFYYSAVVSFRGMGGISRSFSVVSFWRLLVLSVLAKMRFARLVGIG